jgi:hypothetical protein
MSYEYYSRRVEELERERRERQKEFKDRENRLKTEIQNEKYLKEGENRRLRKEQEEERNKLYDYYYGKETDLLKQNYKEKYENDYKRNMIKIENDGKNKNQIEENNRTIEIKKIEDDQKMLLKNMENTLIEKLERKNCEKEKTKIDAQIRKRDLEIDNIKKKIIMKKKKKK